jgi:hypothetical protein
MAEIMAVSPSMFTFFDGRSDVAGSCAIHDARDLARLLLRPCFSIASWS